MDEKIKRWRLILGADSEERLGKMAGGEGKLTGDEALMDMALAALYDNTEQGALGGGGRGPSNPQITRWLGDIRSLFDKDIVTIIQNDAVERKGLKQLLF